MPGISGVVAQSPLEFPHRYLEAFRTVHALAGIDLEWHTHRDGHVALANALTGLLPGASDQPARSPDGTFLFLEGEVHNLADLAEHVKHPIGTSAASTLLALYKERGAEFACLLDGSFNILVYEPERRRLTIFGDHVASRPLYYMEDGGRLLFASEKKSILAVLEDGPRIDPLGVLQVIAHRHGVADRTIIDEMRRLAAGSQLTYEDGRVTCRRYGAIRYSSTRKGPYRDLVAEWGDRLRTAAARQLEGKERLLVSLSGGLDSRAVICAIARDRRPLRARTRGAADCLEVTYAREIARRLGVDLHHEDPTEFAYSALLPRAVWRTEGEVTFINCLTLTAHDRMKALGDHVIGGQYGDAASGAHIYPYMLVPRSRASFLRSAFRWYVRFSPSLLRRVFRAEFLEGALRQLEEEFTGSFARYEGDRLIDVYQAWDLCERQTRMTMGAGPADSHRFEKIYPLMSREHLEFVLGLPWTLRFGQSLYGSMIHALGPEIRDVPNANTGLLLHAHPKRNLLDKGRMLSRKAWARVSGRLGKQPVHDSVSARGDLAVSLRSDAEFQRRLESLVATEYLDTSLFDRQGIRALLAEHVAGAADHAELLCAVASVLQALAYFVYSRPASCPEEAEPVLARTGAPVWA